MAAVAFNHLSVIGFGISGQETARKMARAAEENSLSLIYNPNSNLFTVLHSSGQSVDAIQRIFGTRVHEGWKPKVLQETDELGNKLIRLVSTSIPRRSEWRPIFRIGKWS